jgi:predicted Fe-Mo cluster-binding NifX family protein
LKIAVTAKGKELDSQVDERFGRTHCFIVVDTETGEMKVYDNQVNQNAMQGAGIQSAQNIANIGVDAVLTGHVGPNSFRVLSSAGIDVYTGATGSVRDMIDKFKGGQMSPVSSPDVEGHWII